MSVYCGKCGAVLDDGTKFCTYCGASVVQAPPAYQQPIQPPPVQQMPVQQQVPPQYQYTYGGMPVQPGPPKSSAVAICAFIFSFIIAPVGLILGIIGLVKRNAGLKGMSIAAVIIGGIGTLLALLLSSILIPSMLGYVNKSRVASADSMARSVRNSVNSFMTEADVNGFGIKRGNVQEFDITVSGSKWKVSAADPKNFNTDGNVKWGEGAYGQYDDVVKMAPSGENDLLLAIAELFPDMSTGSMHIAVYNGECTACVVTQETSAGLKEGIDYPDIDGSGDFFNISAWRRSNSAYTVGYCPSI